MLTEHLVRFYNLKRILFQARPYGRIESMPFMASEIEVDQLIAGTSSKVVAFLQFIEETGSTSMLQIAVTLLFAITQ
jgi:hypothetical protein